MIQLYGLAADLVRPGFRWVSQYVRAISCLVGLAYILFCRFESR